MDNVIYVANEPRNISEVEAMYPNRDIAIVTNGNYTFVRRENLVAVQLLDSGKLAIVASKF